MNGLDTTTLPPLIEGRITPLLNHVVEHYGRDLHSIHIIGSAVLPDYDEKVSDINSLIVLRAMRMEFLDFLAPLGNRFGKKRVAAPVVMTPDYIAGSLDSFPVEFLDFKLIHRTVLGEDLLQGLRLERHHLRLQCEREIKARTIGLRQGYLSSVGDRDLIRETLVRSITGSMALFRAVILLLGAVPPIPRADVIAALTAATGIEARIFQDLLLLKAGRTRPSTQELMELFHAYYGTLESVGRIIDGLPAS